MEDEEDNGYNPDAYLTKSEITTLNEEVELPTCPNAGVCPNGDICPDKMACTEAGECAKQDMPVQEVQYQPDTTVSEAPAVSPEVVAPMQAQVAAMPTNSEGTVVVVAVDTAAPGTDSTTVSANTAE